LAFWRFGRDKPSDLARLIGIGSVVVLRGLPLALFSSHVEKIRLESEIDEEKKIEGLDINEHASRRCDPIDFAYKD